MSRRRAETSLYIRPVPDDCRHEDLRRAFGRYGRIVDVTIPIDYYTGRMKGFAFVEFEDIRDAEDAHRAMDHSKFLGRTIDVQFTRGHRKTPSEMQTRDRFDRRRRHSRSRSRSPDRSNRRRGRSFSRSRSPPPVRERNGRDGDVAKYSRSPSPMPREYRGRSRTPPERERVNYSRSRSRS